MSTAPLFHELFSEIAFVCAAIEAAKTNENKNRIIMNEQGDI